MLISYPIIPDHIDGFNAPEPQTAPHGFYPISKQNRWHGGIHLDPGTSADVFVRAIADGKLIAYRQASKPEFKSYDKDQTQPSDTSFVLLKHSTETGDGVNVEFYSLYMHLRNQADFPSSFLGRNRANYVKALCNPVWDTVKVFAEKDAPMIYRKEILGFVGQWTGKHYLHFETFCTDEQLKAFFHDSKSEYQDADKDGHAELWGDTYYMIRPGTDFKATHPDAEKMRQHKYPVQSLQAGTNAQRLYVRMRYDQGVRHVQTWAWDDETERSTALSGERADADYEYNLYQRATDLYSSCPSAGYELLRFGRVIGTDKDKLSASDTVLWESLPFSATQSGYVNLADAKILKFSDADFPHFMDWTKINEDGTFVPDHGRANVNVFADLIKAVDTNHDGDLTKEEYEAYFKSDPTARQRMRRLICQHSSEWDKRTQVARYEDLTHTGEVFDQYPQNHQPFLDFYAKAAFWEEAGLPDKVWYFHPLEFVAHFRKCTWQSEREFKQLLPIHAIRKGKDKHTHLPVMYWEAIQEGARTTPIFDNQRVPLNRMSRKYGISTRERMACFYGNAVEETQWLSSLYEDNSATRYAPWDGRGFLQLTWPSNYLAYWDFRGRTAQITPDCRSTLLAAEHKANTQRNNAALLAAESKLTTDMQDWRGAAGDPPNQTEPTESAGFYWAHLGMARYADDLHILERVRISTNAGQKTYYRSPSFWKASAAVNLPGALGSLYSQALNGFESRCIAYAQALASLSEARFPGPNDQQLEFPEDQNLRKI